jgi:hypothetical protein
MRDFSDLREAFACGERITIQEAKVLLLGEIEEHEYISVIEKVLMTKEEKLKLFIDMELNVLDIISGRFGSKKDEEEYVKELFTNWNNKLGQEVFSY